MDACGVAGGGRVLFPTGMCRSGTLRLRSGVELHFPEGARLTGVKNLDAYAGFLAATGAPRLPQSRWHRGLIVGENCVINSSCNGGRYKPLETLARETLWHLTHQTEITDPDSGKNLEPTAWYLAMLWEWQGWDRLPQLRRTRGVWADYAWGRLWGWDPKEVWALITLLGYLAVLHARHAGWVSHFGLAVLSVLCFSLVVVTWYGVNALLRSGLHRYGFCDGGTAPLLAAITLQVCYLCAVVAQHRACHSRIGARQLVRVGTRQLVGMEGQPIAR